MICNKCKKKVAVNKSVCPYCNNSLVKKVHSSSTGSKNKFIKDDSTNLVGGTVTKGKGTVVKIRNNKNNSSKRNNSIKASSSKNNMKSSTTGAKNKFIKEDSSNLVGGVTTSNKGSFIKLKKDKKGNEIPDVVRKDFVNYLDYKEAKDEANDRRAKLEQLRNDSNVSEKDVSTKLFSIEKVKRSSKVEKELLKHREDYSNLTGSTITSRYDTGLNKKKKIHVQQVPVRTVQQSPFNNVQQPINYGQTFDNSAISNNHFFNIKLEKKNRNLKKEFGLLKYAVVISVWVIAIVLLIKTVNTDFYFGEGSLGLFGKSSTEQSDYLEYDGVSKSGQTGGTSSSGVTSIVYDNQYLSQFVVTDKNAVYDLIVADSVKQKTNCPVNIQAIEKEIIDNYGIVAVNLCEMDETFAKEIQDVVAYIYIKYPNARNHLTNLTLANVDDNTSFMAAFMPIFKFATSSTDTGYPLATKTQILLNARYFLDTTKLENSVDYGVRSGYFPANASRSSTVAHEFGHYLSYVALLNYYESDGINYVEAKDSTLLYQIYDDFNIGNYSLQILEEAYNNYVRETGSTMSFYQFRESISQYAVAKSSNGSYIYDETIAEAFHDYYLNGSYAAPASIAIMEVLNSKL